MGKKKPDFQKAKLRVGRSLPKGLNVTSTAFKSKQILVPEQKLIKSTSKEVNLQEQVSLANHHNPMTRSNALNAICNSLQDDSSLVMDLSAVLDTALRSFLDIEAIVRTASLKLLRIILNLITDVQMESFINPIVLSLNCAMTHSDIKIRQVALQVLDLMFATHSKQLSNFPVLLNSILDMISCKSINKPQGQRKSHRRTLPAVYDESIKSQEWRMNVLKRFEILLGIVVEDMDVEKDETEDENIVHWDGKEPLFLTIYAGGGLKPLKLDMSKEILPDSKNRSWSSDALKSFIDELIPVLMDIYAEEISEFIADSKECYLPENVAENINIIAQIFCHLGQWVKELSKVDEKLESWFTDKFSHVCDALMKGFPYCLKSKSVYQNLDSNPVIVQLNLALCFLCAGFIVERNCPIKLRCEIIKYLNKLFTMKSDIQYCIPILLKIAKCWLFIDFSDENLMAGYLSGLCDIIKSSESRVNRSILINFFLEMVFDPFYVEIIKSPVMKTYFTLVLKEMKKMYDSDIFDKKLLKAIRSICALKHCTFIESVSSVPMRNYINYLKYDEQIDFQETAAYVLCSVKPFDTKYLKDVCEIIVDPLFPYKISYYMIHELSRRFSRNSSQTPRLVFISFLINVACDGFAIDDSKWEEYDDDFDFNENWSLIDEISPYRIYPSDHWKIHCRIFELCKDAFNLFPADECSSCIYHFSIQLLVNNSSFPVHTIIALLKLHKMFTIEQSRQLVTSLNSLLLSCLVYCSVLSQNCISDDFFKYAIDELTDSFDLDTKEQVNNLLRVMKNECQKVRYVDGVEYIMKIINFLMAKQYLHSKPHRKEISPLIEILQMKFGSELHSRSLFEAICDELHFQQ